MKTKVSIIVPTYNEAKIILLFLNQLTKIINRINKEYFTEVIIVDDNSPDETAAIIQKKYKGNLRIKTFVRKKEKGLGTAIGFGIKKSKGEIIIGIDADGNHEIQKIPNLLQNLNNFDLVVASRFIKGGGVENLLDIYRHVASLSLNTILKIVFGFPVWDSTSGFYAIRKTKLIKLGINKIYYGYGDYHLRLVYYAKQHNYRIKEIPYIYKKRIGGTSKSELIKMFLEYFVEAYRLRFSDK